MKPSKEQLLMIKTYLGCTTNLAEKRTIEETVHSLIWLACLLDSDAAYREVHKLKRGEMQNKINGGDS